MLAIKSVLMAANGLRRGKVLFTYINIIFIIIIRLFVLNSQ